MLFVIDLLFLLFGFFFLFIIGFWKRRDKLNVSTVLVPKPFQGFHWIGSFALHNHPVICNIYGDIFNAYS